MMQFVMFKEKGDCRYCHNNCEGEHSFANEKGFIDICDDCLLDHIRGYEI